MLGRGRSTPTIPDNTSTTPTTPTTPAHAPSSVSPDAPKPMASGILGVSGSTRSATGTLPRHASLNPLGAFGGAQPGAAASPKAETDLKEELKSLATAVAKIAAAQGVSLDDEEDPASETDEEEPGAEGDEEEPTGETDDEEPAARGRSASPAASVAQIKAACPGATSDFVVACAEAEMSVKQAKAMFASQKNKIPGRRGRAPLGGGRAGGGTPQNAAAEIGTRLQARADEILRDKGGKIARIDAVGLAMNELKASDPAAFQTYRNSEMARYRRDQIGAASA